MKPCFYNFTIRDGKAPDITCPTDFTVSFDEADPGVATLQIEDVLWSVADNCSPANQIATALRLSGTGTQVFPKILYNTWTLPVWLMPIPIKWWRFG